MKKKNTWRCYWFTLVYHKWQSYHVWFLRYGARQAKMFVILDHFLPIFPLTTPKIKIFKKVRKNTWRYYHFTNVYHEWQYDLWFLRYGEYFVILDHFLSFCSPNNLKNQNFDKNEKTTWRYYHFTYVYHKWQSYDVWFLRHGAQQTEMTIIWCMVPEMWSATDRIFFHFEPFFALLPTNKSENQNFEKMKKKHLAILSFYTCGP